MPSLSFLPSFRLSQHAAVDDDDLLLEHPGVAGGVDHPDAADLLQVLQPLGHLPEDQRVLVLLVVDVAHPHHELAAHPAAALARALDAAHAHRALGREIKKKKKREGGGNTTRPISVRVDIRFFISLIRHSYSVRTPRKLLE